MRAIVVGAVLACTAAAMPAALQAQASAPATTPAGQIAELMAPRDLLLEGTARNFDQQFARGMATDPRTAVFETAHPGVTAEAAAAARKVVIAAVTAALPRLRASTATVIGDNMDGVEQDGLLVFLRSPAGHRLVTMGDQIYSTDKIVDATKANGGKLTQQQMSAAIDPSFVNKLTPAEIEQIGAFSATPAGRKLQIVTPKLQATIVEWANGVMTAQQGPVQQAVIGAIQAHVAAEKPH